METIELEEGARVIITYDAESESPRDWSPMGKLTIREHRRYTFPQEIQWDFEGKNPDILAKYWVFPLECYEHSGISFSISGTGPQFRFDTSPYAGVIAIPKEYCGYDAQEWSVSAKKGDNKTMDEEDAKKQAKSELDTYNQWLSGEVYHCEYQELVETYRKDGTRYGTDFETVESCGGFYDTKDFADMLPEKHRATYLKRL